MKKLMCIICCALLLLAAGALAEEESGTVISFEDGFSLTMPDGWRYYAVDDAMREGNVIYCMSNAGGTDWMYVQQWEDGCADVDALLTLIQTEEGASLAGIYTFGDTDFVVYETQAGNVSCCATVIDGKVLNFVFTPKDDADFMLTATQIITSFQSK